MEELQFVRLHSGNRHYTSVTEQVSSYSAVTLFTYLSLLAGKRVEVWATPKV